MTVTAVKAWTGKLVNGLAEAWCYGVQQTYLEPLGVTMNTRFSWNAETVADIKARNPALAGENFLLPTNAARPFPIIGATLVGPWAGALK